MPLTSYTGAHGHVALYTPGTSSGNTAALDDFTLELAPPCARPENLRMSAVGNDSVVLDWDAPDTATTAWRIIYVPSGLPITSDSAVIDYPTSHPHTIHMLEPGTAYDFYVYTECANSDYSFDRMITVNTFCSPIDTLPYFYGFEGTDASTSGTIDVCWVKGTQFSSVNYPYPSTAHFSGSRSLYFYAYHYDNMKSWAVMPMFSDSIDDLQVSFKLLAGNMASWYCNELVVGLSADPYDISTFTPITRCEATNSTTWDSFTVILTGHQSAGRFITFMAQARNSSQYYNEVYIDDVVVDHAPNCGPVTDVNVMPSSTSAIATWTPSVRGESQGASIEYRPANDSTSDWITDVTTDNYIILSGLSPVTQYVLRIYNSCIDGNSPTYTEVYFNTSGFSCVPDTTLAVVDTIGDGFGTNTYLPSYSYYGNGYSQQYS